MVLVPEDEIILDDFGCLATYSTEEKVDVFVASVVVLVQPCENLVKRKIGSLNHEDSEQDLTYGKEITVFNDQAVGGRNLYSICWVVEPRCKDERSKIRVG